MIKTLEWTDAGVRFIDQRKLPTEETYVTCGNYEEVANAIRSMMGQTFRMKTDCFMASCASWSEFWKATKRLSPTSEKGAVFERLTQLYLQTVPEYQSELAHIWTLREVPQHVRKLLALPVLDEGIDFIAQTRHGKYWAIQSKFRSQHDKPLTRTELGTFSSLAFNTCINIELAVAHTRHRNRSASDT